MKKLIKKAGSVIQSPYIVWSPNVILTMVIMTGTLFVYDFLSYIHTFVCLLLFVIITLNSNLICSDLSPLKQPVTAIYSCFVRWSVCVCWCVCAYVFNYVCSGYISSITNAHAPILCTCIHMHTHSNIENGGARNG